MEFVAQTDVIHNTNKLNERKIRDTFYWQQQANWRYFGLKLWFDAQSGQFENDKRWCKLIRKEEEKITNGNW